MQSTSLPYTRARALTRRGRSHEVNDDRYILLDGGLDPVRASRRGAIYAVSDGVSSLREGFVAAEVTTERLINFFTTRRPPTEDLLLDLVETADAEVRLVSDGACTLAGIWLAQGITTVFSIGDTEVLLLRDGGLRRLNPLMKRGGGLAAYVGMGDNVRHHVFLRNLPLLPGDVFVLASDGLLGAVPPVELQDLLTWHNDDALDQIQARLEQQQPDDDATLVVVEVLAREASTHQLLSMMDG